MHTNFWSENLKGKDHSGDLNVDEIMILEWMLRRQGGKVWTGVICLRIGNSDRLL
jgi:hypothetical protein